MDMENRKPAAREYGLPIGAITKQFTA